MFSLLGVDHVPMARTTIRVPDEWADDAREMDVSLAEYCRRMARAGRRQFGVAEQQQSADDRLDVDEGDYERTVAVEKLVYERLRPDRGRDVSELVDLIEDDIVAAADALVADGQVKYRASEGGWMRVTDE